MKKAQPPRQAKNLFIWWCGNAAVDDLQGDLDEWFHKNSQSMSARRARWIYWKQVISLCLSYAVRKRKSEYKNRFRSGSTLSPDMIYNFFKVAIRNLNQHRYFSLLNVFGLAIGMSVSLLQIALLSYVSTYDDFQVHGDHIFTIVSERKNGPDAGEYATAPVALAEKLAQHSDIRQVVRINGGFREEIISGQSTLPIQGYYVDPSFLGVFSYDITQGNGVKALSKPNSLIITESAARRLFNTTEVLGKTVALQQGGLLEIGAVMKDHPVNSHLRFEALVSFSTLPNSTSSFNDQWMHYGREYVYILLRKGADPKDIDSYLQSISNKTYDRLAVQVAFATQHLDKITTGPDYRQAIGPKWDATSMFIFSIIALMILLPACFNYTNISIARAMKRAKEIGLRKTMGGVRNQIFFQFITETMVITFLSLIVAVGIFVVIRSEFKSMLAASASLDLSLTIPMLLAFFVFSLFTGLVAGIFPALYFGKLSPIQALKSKIAGKSYALRVRKGLTVFQFALTFGFVFALIVFHRQYQYSIGFDFGFNQDNVVNVPLQGVEPSRVENIFSKLAPVSKVTFASNLLGMNFSESWIRHSPQDSLKVAQLFVDANYLSAFGITLLAGKTFPEENWTRERFMIVNEEFIKAYQIASPGAAIGRTFEIDGVQLEVIGVVRNFHYAALRFPIDKFVFRMNPRQYAYAHLVVRTTDPDALYAQMREQWKTVSDSKLEARFFSAELEEGYNMYQSLLKIIGFLGLLALTISIMGMLGMVVYSAETRAKEVGIRKAMGASVSGVTLLLSKEYLYLMAWAIFISLPVSVSLIDFVMPMIQYYSVSVNIWDVLFSIFILLGVGLVTIASQTIKTARLNPVDVLRNE